MNAETTALRARSQARALHRLAKLMERLVWVPSMKARARYGASDLAIAATLPAYPWDQDND